MPMHPSVKMLALLTVILFSGVPAMAEAPPTSGAASGSLPHWLPEMLASRHIGLRTPEGGGTRFCSPPGGAPARNSTHEFICEATVFDAAYGFTGATRRGLDAATLEVRSFASPEEATSFKSRLVAMWGNAELQGHGGASFIVHWWEAEFLWTETKLYILFANMRHLRQFANSRAVIEGLSAEAVPFPPSGAIGAVPTGTRLLFRDPGSRPVPDAQRFSAFVQVIDVAPNDTLALRDRPDARSGERLTSVPPGARCVPVVFAPRGGSWIRVKWNGVEGWVSRRHTSDEPTGACRPAVPSSAPLALPNRRPCVGLEVRDERGQLLSTHDSVTRLSTQGAPAIFGQGRCPDGSTLWLGGDHSKHQDLGLCISADGQKVQRIFVRASHEKPGATAGASLAVPDPGMPCWINADEPLDDTGHASVSGACLALRVSLVSRSSGTIPEPCAGSAGRLELSGELELRMPPGSPHQPTR